MNQTNVHEPNVSKIIKNRPTEMVKGEATFAPDRVAMIFGLFEVDDRAILGKLSPEKMISSPQDHWNREKQKSARHEHATNFSQCLRIIRDVLQYVQADDRTD